MDSGMGMGSEYQSLAPSSVRILVCPAGMVSAMFFGTMAMKTCMPPDARRDWIGTRVETKFTTLVP